MVPNKVLSELTALKTLVDCVLKSNEKSFECSQQLFNIKRLILEIQYENIEKKNLESFLRDLNKFVETKLEKMDGKEKCKEILKLLCNDTYNDVNITDYPNVNGVGRPNSLYEEFFRDAKADDYACKGKKINFTISVIFGEVVSKKDLLEHRILPGIVTDDDLSGCKGNNEFCKKVAKLVKEISLIAKQPHPNAFFVSKQDKLMEVISDTKAKVVEKLFKIGINPINSNKKDYFVIYFSIPQINIYTPTTLDVHMNIEKYFLPAKPNSTHTGHWGVTLSLLNPEEEGVPEAVIRSGKYEVEAFDIGYVGEVDVEESVKKPKASLESQFHDTFILFAKNLQVNYTINKEGWTNNEK